MANSFHAPTVSCPIHIHAVDIDFSKFKTNIKAFDVWIGKSSHPPSVKYEARKSLRQTFSPSIVFSPGDTFSLHIQYIDKSLFLERKTEEVTINPDDLFRLCSIRNGREYIKSHNKARIIINLSRDTRTKRAAESVSSRKRLKLRPTADEIFRKCPRFRILLIGRPGVGKSSLLCHAFGVERMFASYDKPGEANIDHEFISPQNDRLVIHDSRGFEPGKEDGLEIVRDFVERRRKMSPEDQLHAIWLCFEIPRGGGRLLETGTEEFLKLTKDGMLGNIPVIVVLTKYDIHLDRIERNLDESCLNGLSDKAIMELAKDKAETELRNNCITPLQQIAGPDIPCATTSNYKETLIRLIRITEDCVDQDAAAVLNFIARQIYPEFKIKASIEICKKRYRKVLASSTTSKNRQRWESLLHTNTVNMWNFYDPHHYLHSQEFRALMTNMVDKLELTANLAHAMAQELSMAGGIPVMFAALLGPLGLIAVPIIAGAVLATCTCKAIHAVFRRAMFYIVHLTLVLQTLDFVSERQELTRRVIKLVVSSYLASPMYDKVLTLIQDYDKQLTTLECADRNSLDKIVEIIQYYSIDAAEMSELREKIHSVGLLPDEPW